MWYVDCYCHGALCGRDFPVNSYYSESLQVIIEVADRVLSNDVSGIDEVRIGKETKGQNPVYATLATLAARGVEQDVPEPQRG
jgi:hypothetical protein